MCTYGNAEHECKDSKDKHGASREAIPAFGVRFREPRQSVGRDFPGLKHLSISLKAFIVQVELPAD